MWCQLIRPFYGVLLLCGLAACASQDPYPVGTAPAGPDQSYLLSTGEALTVTTYGEQSLTVDFTIGTNGKLPFPLIGDIEAAGKTPKQLEEGITAALADGFVLNPRVSVQVKSFKPVYVMGEVNKPGEYAYTPGMTVLAAVAKAEGFTYRAQQKRVFLKRAGQAAETEITLTSDVVIFPGDTLRIGERYF